MSTPGTAADSHSWVLLEYEDEGYPVVMKVIGELPPDDVRRRFGWLSVVTWQYDRTDNNGMPPPAVNSQMVQLESAIDGVQEKGLCLQVYSKTGNGLKELVYYIGDRDGFMHAFNEALAGQPRYPLDIAFFEDAEWRDLQAVQGAYLKKH